MKADKRGRAFWAGVTAGSGSDVTSATGVTRGWLDDVRKPVLGVSVPQVGAPQRGRPAGPGPGL